MSELDDAIKETERTIEILQRNSRGKWAEELERLLNKVRATDGYTQKEALFSIGQFCHPKALGDAYITGIDSQTWNKQLETLSDSCAKAFNILDKQLFNLCQRKSESPRRSAS
jgi:hypothetical protein